MRPGTISPALRLALVYFTISVLWILFSDRIVDTFVHDPAHVTTIQTIKGWGFVLATAVLLYWLARQDMRQLKEESRELEIWGRKLEERVAERTADLNAANAHLRELDTLKTQLISDISHELRSPITSMGLKIEMMERADAARRGAYIIGLKEQISLLRELLDDVMDISWLENEARIPELAPVDLCQLAGEIVDEHRPVAQATGLHLNCEIDPSIPPILGRHSQLSRVLSNLVTNAIKYTVSGGVNIRMRFDQSSNEAVMQVEDTGLGIPPEELKHLFKRFYRGQSVKEKGIPGSGLGLSIVKEIVEANRGTISVESQVNQGSTFTVRLPVKQR